MDSGRDLARAGQIDHCPVREGRAAIVQLLLEHGADARTVVERLCRLPLRTVDVAAARGFGDVVAIIDKAIQARQRLGLSEGVVRGRLARARDQLHRRLTRRGVVPSVGVMAAVLGADTASALTSPTLINSTIQAGIEKKKRSDS